VLQIQCTIVVLFVHYGCIHLYLHFVNIYSYKYDSIMAYSFLVCLLIFLFVCPSLLCECNSSEVIDPMQLLRDN
jgi:hypothetical protein